MYKSEIIAEKVHEILKDPACAGNVRCIVWAAVVVCLYFSFMIYGFFLLENAYFSCNPTTIEQNKDYVDYQFSDGKGLYRVFR
jgi:hypothetical protein